ncbi:MAG: hypothetical protein ACTSWW_01285 [Promethearchaeota archaeon]
MSQINIRVNEQTDRIFHYLAKKRKIPKAVLVKEMLLDNLKEKVLVQLLKEYEQGEIRLKTIGNLLELSPHELFMEIATHNIECPITPEIDEYTRSVTEKIINRLQLEKYAKET